MTISWTRANGHHGLYSLLSSYPIVSELAGHLTTPELLRLALTSRTTYTCILGSRATFEALKRNCLCDGYGIAARRTFQGEVLSYTRDHAVKHTRRPADNLQCDSTRVRPCQKCGTNVCEECRYFLRVYPRSPEGRPHLNPAYVSTESLVAMCPECDERTEGQVGRKFPVGSVELCDCDLFDRWICHRCRCEEQAEGCEYYRERVTVVGMRDLPDAVASKSILYHALHSLRVSHFPP